jgi:MYXO-CTERM domain-containing protein
VAAVLLAGWRAAEACPRPMTLTRDVDVGRASPVPTSVRPRVVYRIGPGCPVSPPAPVIRLSRPDASPGGAEIPGAWVQPKDVEDGVVFWEFRPAWGLLPRTEYEVLDGFAAECACGGPGACAPGPLAVAARFVTGDTSDPEPPRRAQPIAFWCVPGSECTNGATALVADVRDDADMRGAYFYVRRDGEPYDYDRPVDGTRLWALDPGRYFLRVRLFDATGNEEQSDDDVAFTVPLDGDPLCQPRLADRGCACDAAAAAPSSAAPIFALVAALAALLRRRT